MTGVPAAAADPDGLVTVGRFLDPIAAEFARSRLASDGLDGFVQGGGLGSLLPTGVVFPILLQVRAGDAARAAEILAALPEPDLPADGRERDGEDPPGKAAGS